ncbi:cyclin-domain-containing protein [Eremomyces bilateralis CBS 781.70]|uniref:Cyclin-domain-containing protein n=1 Tax=Eremomyces bilateralis CBS 781.70 TaxID=1392243 RepID=A0A6G1GCB7_9PEZI|nr:cyclin-domain-containing protein [Eremomyces bilateralis CBS 781.70]KAF1815674.1 cyclin-domain-containing protein [Eremomyces bilateralis CBS 781.70]
MTDALSAEVPASDPSNPAGSHEHPPRSSVPQQYHAAANTNNAHRLGSPERRAFPQQPPAAQFAQARISTPSGSSSGHTSPAHSVRSVQPPVAPSPGKIVVKDLMHIQSFALDAVNPSSGRSSSRHSRHPNEVGPHYEISEMPIGDIIEMVAGLLTKITTTNDRQHDYLHRQANLPETHTHGLTQQTTSILAFHGKNVPSISILSYLSRIHKYCPTTYEVFLSLLVYFDRMTERVNAGPMLSLRQANQASIDRHASASYDSSRHSSISSASLSQPLHSNGPSPAHTATPPPSGSLGHPASLRNSTQSAQSTPPFQTPHGEPSPPSPALRMDPRLDTPDPYNLSHFFVVDSFNIHRLIIAGVTCASKFFSDVFYTNSRYAKVGGLPLQELNHLELQFLLLNDFRLAVPLEEMEAYGTMLVEFYAREVVAQQRGQGTPRVVEG